MDVIYHCAADVNHLYNYDHLRKVNVQATLELMKFSTHNRLKKLNYVSTLSTISERNEMGLLIENFLKPDKKDLVNTNGYSQTKWTSEVLLKIASDAGIPINIFRPGWILWNKNTPMALIKKNTLFTLFQTCLSLRCAPNWKLALNLMVVDNVSQFIVATGQENIVASRVFNMINKTDISWQTVVKLMKTKKYIMNSIDPKSWYEKCSLNTQTLSVLTTIKSAGWLALNSLLKNIEHSGFNAQLKKLNIAFDNAETLVYNALLPLVTLNNIVENQENTIHVYS